LEEKDSTMRLWTPVKWHPFSWQKYQESTTATYTSRCRAASQWWRPLVIFARSLAPASWSKRCSLSSH